MEVCARCPIREERYETSSQSDKRRIADLFLANQRMGDFILWLFDESEHCDHIPYSEAWEEFEKWEDTQVYLHPTEEVD